MKLKLIFGISAVAFFASTALAQTTVITGGTVWTGTDDEPI